mgnify:CR=1 FL=1
MTTAALQFNKFEIKHNITGETVDLRGSGTPIIEYRESVFMPYVEITAYIVDTGNTLPANDGTDAGIGLLEAGFCQGTEQVLFSIADEKGNKINLSNENALRVASIADTVQSFKNTTFTMTVVSKEAFDNCDVDNRCKLKYSGPISDIARAIVRHDLKSSKWQSMNIDATSNHYHEWGQERYPFEMLLDLQQLSIPDGIQTSKGKAPQGNTAGYLFWETSNGYQFKSLDKLFDTRGRTIKKYIENSKADDSLPLIKENETYDGKILWSNMTKNVDALNQFESGAWGTEIRVFNDVTKEYEKIRLEADGTGNGISAGRHLPQLNSEYKDVVTVIENRLQAVGQTVKGYDSIEEQVKQTDQLNYDVKHITQQAHQNYRQKMNTSLDIVIDADLSLHAGDLIFCDFLELSTKKTLRESRHRSSGIYMIADLCHYGDVGNSFTGLHLVRDSYGVKT